jgi:hypothetical protein
VIKKEDRVKEGKETINKETSNRPKEQANSVRILCLFKMLGESRVNPDVLHTSLRNAVSKLYKCGRKQ